MPYENVTSYRNIIISCEVKDRACACKAYLRVIFAGFLTSLLVENSIRFQFVSESDAVKVLFDKFLSCFRSEFACSYGSSEFEIRGINVFKGSYVLLYIQYRSFFQHEIVNKNISLVAGFYIDVNISNVFREAEFDFRDLDPFTLADSGIKVIIMTFSLGVSIFKADFNRIVPLSLYPCADKIFSTGFAFSGKSKLRTVPAGGSVGNFHTGIFGMTVVCNSSNSFDAASASKLGDVLFAVKSCLENDFVVS